MLVIQVANPSGVYSPFRNPDYAKDRQKYVLDQMIDHGLLDRDKAYLSLETYWNSFDWSKDNYSSAFYDRREDDKAPWFSEYIRNQLNELLLQSADFYRDGYMVHTTLDLKVQNAANRNIASELNRWTQVYNEDMTERISYVDESYTSLIDLLSLVFNIEGIRVAGSQDRMRARSQFFQDINPTIDILSKIFGLGDLNYVSNAAYGINKDRTKQTTIQTALITLGNEDYNEGYITAMIGGSQFSRTNQLNRAMDAQVSPGSSFKPLYYSAAISSRIVTPATQLQDKPYSFKNADGTFYTPYNYKGTWEGTVLLRHALATSMNVPSIQVMEKLGLDRAIERAAALLGIDDPAEIERIFPRVYPLALGIIRTAPVNMARAYATISNYGKVVEPFGIRYIEDRDGNIILNPEKDLRNELSRSNRQVMTPQEAYIMINLLHSTVMEGTLRYPTNFGRITPGIQLGGKTGTTQNWGDAWTCGFSPYYTTVIWAGFDEKGSTLGIHLTGSTATGNAWANYMEEIHQGLEPKIFPRPDSGLVDVEICTLSGQKPTDSCPRTRTEIFLSGTEPQQFCQQHSFYAEQSEEKSTQLKGNFALEGVDTNTYDSSLDSFDDFLHDMDLDIDIHDDEEESRSNNGSINSSFLD
jgi:penicillin-binding protein 1A